MGLIDILSRLYTVFFKQLLRQAVLERLVLLVVSGRSGTIQLIALIFNILHTISGVGVCAKKYRWVSRITLLDQLLEEISRAISLVIGRAKVDY